MRKTFFVITLVLVMAAACFTAYIKEYSDRKEYSVEQFTLNYAASVGGHIEGETNQIVSQGASASSVTAISDAGYDFVGWSDSNPAATRTDRHVRSNLNLTANFEKITCKIYTYVYNEATDGNSSETVELTVEGLPHTTLAVPEREGFVFCGWYLDWLFSVQVSDEFGRVIIDDDEVFAINSNQLFAKWMAVNAATYEILMVYVTEIRAELERLNGENITVEYQMTEKERRVCELISTMFGQYLNALMNGLVVFEIDNYFTTEALTGDSLSTGADAWGNQVYMLEGYNISEIGSMLSNYRSVITTFSMNDYDFQLIGGGGYGSDKYAGVHLEPMLYSYVMNPPYQIDTIFDFSNKNVAFGWESKMQLYLHEFTHTVEMNKSNMEINDKDSYFYHDTLIYYGNKYGNISHGLGAGQSGISEIEVIRLFLLNQAVVDDEYIGIPKSFWYGQTDVMVNYVPNVIEGRSGGQIKIVGDTSERPIEEDSVTEEVPFGSSLKVIAIPNNGYKFVKWSDGITNAERNDTNIISYLTVKAIFKRI